MSQEEDNNSAEEDEEEEQDEEEEEGDEDEDEDADEDEEGDEQQGQEDEEQGEQEQQEGQQEEQSEPPQKQEPYKVPDFPRRSLKAPENPFGDILYELNSLQSNVNSFIDSLPSRKGMQFGSYVPIRAQELPNNTNRLKQLTDAVSKLQISSNIVHVKDSDTQVDMQPQIIIKATMKEPERAPDIPKPYHINTESEKFLNSYYEDTKKYRRWDRNPEPQFRNRQRFERKQFQKGVFDIEQRNKEIDQAMRVLRQDS